MVGRLYIINKTGKDFKKGLVKDINVFLRKRKTVTIQKKNILSIEKNFGKLYRRMFRKKLKTFYKEKTDWYFVFILVTSCKNDFFSLVNSFGFFSFVKIF